MRVTFNITDFNSIDSTYVEEFQEGLKRANTLISSLTTFTDLLKNNGVEFNNFGEYVIEMDGTNYANEFTVIAKYELDKENSKYKSDSVVEIGETRIPIEILRSCEAEYNEKEEILGGCVIGVDTIEGYKLGETVQTYIRIGETNYWYREL